MQPGMLPLCLFLFNFLPVRSWLDTNHCHLITESGESGFIFIGWKNFSSTMLIHGNHKILWTSESKKFKWDLGRYKGPTMSKVVSEVWNPAYTYYYKYSRFQIKRFQTKNYRISSINIPEVLLFSHLQSKCFVPK